MAGQEHGPDDTALCDASLLVDIVDAKGGDGSPQRIQKSFFQERPWSSRPIHGEMVRKLKPPC